jgi:hypothetical protein
MQTIIGITKEKHKTLFTGNKRTFTKPTTDFVYGHQLLHENIPVEYVGKLPKIIHQTWKDGMLPSRWCKYFDNWHENHPDFLHVLWTDNDNDNLVEQYYPEFLMYYQWLPLMIQKTDLVRLMYLHRFGGIYADLDYECFDNLLPHLPQMHGVMLVESPLTFTEITQNSLMISEPAHPYVYNVLTLISEICDDVMDLKSIKYPFSNLYKNLFFGKLLHTLSTLFLTGPSTLDKTFVRASLISKNDSNAEVAILPHDIFYEGIISKHHHNGSWFDGKKLSQVFFIAIAFTVIAIVLTSVLTTFYSTKAVYLKKYQKRYSN